MGLLVDGRWQADDRQLHSKDGKFVRRDTAFRNWITADGQACPTGGPGFRAEPGRYHLYVSLACPWAHRTLIMRSLKGLDEMIGVSVVHWLMGDQGWTFDTADGGTGDCVNGAELFYQVYVAADGEYTGRVSVPVLWDRETSTIVNNESSEIIRMMGTEFDSIGALEGNYYPEAMRDEIDLVNARVYETLNNGVYRCGFAASQAAYEVAVIPLFDTLDWLEERLSRYKFVAGNQFSEADIRLFTTLIRFDAVYHGHFKCNIRQLKDYPNLWAYTRQIFQMDAVHPTVDFGHIKRHYYASHLTINPTGIVPMGPFLDYDAPHGRG